MNTIIAIIIGAVIWQSITVAFMVITDENTDIYVPVAMGIWTPILFAIGSVIHKIRLLWCRRYNLYQLYADGTAHSKPEWSWLHNVYMTEKTAKMFRDFDKYGYDYSVKFLRSGKEFKQPPLKQDIVKPGKYAAIGRDDLVQKFLEKGA